MRATLTEASISAPQMRYTDLDVKTDPAIMEWAVRYVNYYQGEFEPMREAQAELLRTGALTVQTARRVMNCARNDYQVQAHLPVPRREIFVVPDPQPDSAYVQNLRSRAQAVATEFNLTPAKSVKRWYEAIEERPATIKAPYFVTKTGQYIHRVDLESTEHHTRWAIKGWPSWRGNGTLLAKAPERVFAGITVRSTCSHPRVARNATLLREADLELALATPRHLTANRTLVTPVMCPRCCTTKEIS